MLKNKKIRTRIAPAPTGTLHVGTARTALFNYLFAKKNQGELILRIEDTDTERSDPKWEKDIIESLEWLGIKWDYGPYKQSERLDIYKKYLEKLLSEDKAYYCFCSKEDLEAHRQYQRSIGQPINYSGKCRDLSKKEIEENIKQKKPFVIRFKVLTKKLKFKDLVKGDLEFDTSLIGDIAIAKSLSLPLYNLAVVVDDFEMKISHIIRGEDILSNTPKQILIQEALGFPKPEYAHLPLILGSDRSKLSKRHGAVGVSEYRKMGYLPEAMINFIAFLGWNPGTEREIFFLKSLVKEFSLEKVQSGGAIFNIKKLDSLNSFYIRQRSIEKLTELCIPYFIDAGFIEPDGKNNAKSLSGSKAKGQVKLISEEKPKFKIKETNEVATQDYLEKIVAIYQERLRKLSEITELTDFFFKKKLEYEKELLFWKNIEKEELISTLNRLKEKLSKIQFEDFVKENLERILIPEAERFTSTIKSAKVGDRGYFLWPLRVLLTGKKASAGPFEIAEILGKEKVLKRIEEAKELIK